MHGRGAGIFYLNSFPYMFLIITASSFSRIVLLPPPHDKLLQLLKFIVEREKEIQRPAFAS